MLTTVLLSSAVSGAEAPPIQSGPNPTQFTGRVFTLAADNPLKQIGGVMIVFNKILLVEEFIKIFEKKLIDEFGLDLGVIEGTTKGIAPIVYSSILNKKVSARPRIVEVSADFFVPPEHAESWDFLRDKIERGDDLSPYLSKDHKFWSKADFLLYCSNIHHIHLTTRRGVGTNVELVYGVFADSKFYAIHFGDHHDIYKIGTLYEKAEASWPGQLFRYADDGSQEHFYDKRMVNDPSRHMNLLRPAGKMSGHQRTHLISLTDGDSEISNVPLELWFAFDNEVAYLTTLEDRLSGKHGYLAQLKLNIDFEMRRYKIESGGFQRYLYGFSKDVTISSTVAKFHHDK
ncbi:hypothetical protein [Pseudomonas syringae]|uniref:hypothetical protein n=1 Tax=Pseudomonas syringae TaxID=317 RepID=UPI0013C29F89|nr:hypothetical protein [Pseudomonas syringae]